MNYKEFLNEVKSTKSPNTYTCYCNALRHFKKGDKAEIIKLMADFNLKGSTKKQILNILLLALKWYGRNDKDIERLITLYRPNEEIQPCPTTEDVDLIWSRIDNVRQRAIFALLAYNGLRLSEVINLNVEDINDGVLLLRNTKGKRDNYAPIVHPRAINAMKEWMEIRNSFPTSSDAMFINANGGRLSSSYVKQWVQKVCALADCPQYHAHSFRRYFANTLSQSGVSLQDIKELMRHRSVNTTMLYLNIGVDNMRDKLERVYQGG